MVEHRTPNLATEQRRAVLTLWRTAATAVIGIDITKSENKMGNLCNVEYIIWNREVKIRALVDDDKGPTDYDVWYQHISLRKQVRM